MSPTRSYLLMGSGEFEPWSESVEQVALQGRSGGVAILPTASATEGDQVFERWGRTGLEHYAAMGVEARVVPVRTRADAERDDLAEQVRATAMVFFSGGNPQYLASVLAGTRLWAAVLEALDAGAVYAGCSAGAMVASRSPETRPRLGAAWVSGLGLVPNLSIGVHWDRVRAVPGFRAFVLSRAKGRGVRGHRRAHGDPRRWRALDRARARQRDGAVGGNHAHVSSRGAVRDDRARIGSRAVFLTYPVDP